MTVDLSDVPTDLREPVAAALAAASVDHGHLSVELVDSQKMQALNLSQRGIDAPTDVLAFPIDGVSEVAGPRELGDVVICPEHSEDVREVAVHGVLHLCGFDHETDDGEMLDVQGGIMAALGGGEGAR